MLLRKTEYHFNTNHILRFYIFKLRLLKLQNKYSIHIPLNTCRKGLRVMHVGPVLVNGNASIGEYCTFHMNTAIVADGINGNAATLDDGVIVGIGAVVVGDVYIAKNVAIGANAVVTKNITEENIAVAGVPAKQVSRNGRLEWNKNNNKL